MPTGKPTTAPTPTQPKKQCPTVVKDKAGNTVDVCHGTHIYELVPVKGTRCQLCGYFDADRSAVSGAVEK